jgi:hypothetical protein
LPSQIPASNVIFLQLLERLTAKPGERRPIFEMVGEAAAELRAKAANFTNRVGVAQQELTGTKKALRKHVAERAKLAFIPW